MSFVCKTRVFGAFSHGSESGVEPPHSKGERPAAPGAGSGKQRPYEGTKSRFPACGRQARRVAPPFAKHTQGSRAGGMTMAGVEVDEPRATQKPHVSSRKTRANGT